MITLAKWEVEELRDALSVRTRLWQKVSDTRWIRHTHSNENRFALSVQNGLPRGMYSVTVEALRSEPPSDLDIEVATLLKTLTSYGSRVEVEEYLRLQGISNVDVVAHTVCSVVNVGIVPVIETAVAPQFSTPTDVQKPQRSTYLERLLRGKK